MAMGMVIVVILVIKWGIQYNWCRVFKCCKQSESESADRKRDNSKHSKKFGDIEMAERGPLMRQTDSSNGRLAETHNLTNIRHTDKLTVSPRQTESDTEHRMVPIGPNTSDLEVRLLEGFTHFIAGMKQNMENA